MAFGPNAAAAGVWRLPDEEATLAELALNRLADETACVPGLFWDEVRHLLPSAERRGPVAPGYADASMTRNRRLPFQTPGETEGPPYPGARSYLMASQPAIPATWLWPFGRVVRW